MPLNTVLAHILHFVDESQNGTASVASVETLGSFTRTSGFVGEGGRDITRYSVRITNTY